MPNHHHRPLNTGHPRAEKRQDYARLYVCVRFVERNALCDADGKVLAWTDWSEACTAAGKAGMIVVNWQGFHERYLPVMAPRPPAARIFARGKRGVRTYHAELDAPYEELRTLNNYCDWEVERAPGKVGEKLSTAKVWPEDEA
jgi:hypothetical protein